MWFIVDVVFDGEESWPFRLSNGPLEIEITARLNCRSIGTELRVQNSWKIRVQWSTHHVQCRRDRRLTIFCLTSHVSHSIILAQYSTSHVSHFTYLTFHISYPIFHISYLRIFILYPIISHISISFSVSCVRYSIFCIIFFLHRIQIVIIFYYIIARNILYSIVRVLYAVFYIKEFVIL